MAIQEHTRRLNNCLFQTASHSDSGDHGRSRTGIVTLHLLAVAWGRTSLSSPRPRPLPSEIFVDINGAFRTLDGSGSVIL